MLVYEETLEGCHKTSSFPPQRSKQDLGNYASISHTFIPYLIVLIYFCYLQRDAESLHSFDSTPLTNLSHLCFPFFPFMVTIASFRDCILITCHGHTFYIA